MRARLAPYFTVPAVVVAASFVAICVHLQTLWPWTRIIHESGDRTLLGTIFYFEHALRELPLDVLLGFAIAGSVLFFFAPPVALAGRSAELRDVLLRGCVLGIAIVIAVIIIGSVVTVGAAETLDNLLQRPTRAGALPEWGAHWRYHLLERLATMLLSFSVVGTISLLPRAAPAATRSGSARSFLLALACFAGLSLLFRPSLEPFRDVLFLAHQARELFTHTLVTLPLAIGSTLWVAARLQQPADLGADQTGHALDVPSETSRSTIRFDRHDPFTVTDRAPTRLSAQRMSVPEHGRLAVYVAGAISVLIGVYLAIGVLITDGASQGQTTSLTRLIGAHFFEHSFTYVVVPLVAAIGYVLVHPATQN